MINEANGIGVVSSPRIVHADCVTEQISRLCGRMRRIHPDTLDDTLVPVARDRVGWARIVPIDLKLCFTVKSSNQECEGGEATP